MIWLAGAIPSFADAPSKWLSPHFKDHPLVGTIWSGNGRRTEWAELEDAAAASRFVLAGEIHSNPDHHILQANLLDAMIGAGRTPALVFEMIPAVYQAKLDDFLASSPADAADLGAALDWEERGWPQWSIYQPVADRAVASGLPVLAGDLDRETIRTIGRQGRAALTGDQQERLAVQGELPAELATRLNGILQESHCNLLPEQAIGPMMLVQRARDGSLAAALSDAVRAGSDGALLIAGAGHVRRDLAVPRILEAKRPDDKILALAFVEVSESLTEARDYGMLDLYDFIVFTPRADLTDHCAELAEQMKGKRDSSAD